jgi:hypothetical protein
MRKEGALVTEYHGGKERSKFDFRIEFFNSLRPSASKSSVLNDSEQYLHHREVVLIAGLAN